MDLSDLPLLVPLSAFSDYIYCSICMTQFTATHTTPCGHRYCEKCIKEWVDRHHNCPCCNQPVQTDQLVKDHQFDGLIAAMLVEKDKSETHYFERLLHQAASSDTDGPRKTSQSPVEEVLKKHLIKSLAAYERFCQDLKRDFSTKELRLQEETSQAVGELQGHGLSLEETQSQTEDLQNTLERQKQCLTKELNTCLAMVGASYDKYLSCHIPSLDVLPVKVSIYLLEKDIRIPNVQLQPKDSLNDVQSVLQASMAQINNPIISMDENVKWIIFGDFSNPDHRSYSIIDAFSPFAKSSPWDMRCVAQELIEGGNSNRPGVTVISDPGMLSVQYSVKPNSELVVWGTVRCESDLPKQCFVNIFKAGEPTAVDYFSCKSCGFNWVCRSCRDACHQGHEIVPYIMNHRPTWACCYCPKKKTCVLQAVK